MVVLEDVFSLANCIVCGGSYLVSQEYVCMYNRINVDSVHTNPEFSNYLCLLELHMYTFHNLCPTLEYKRLEISKRCSALPHVGEIRVSSRVFFIVFYSTTNNRLV